MKIATWNINGVKARMDGLCAWLNAARPDIACLQEIKSTDEAFPAEPIENLGYNVHTHGQKGFNGVAIVSRRPIEDVMEGLPGDESDEQARYLEATVCDDDGASVRVAALYLPNGNPLGSAKFSYKLAWMKRLRARAAELLESERRIILAGDFNVIPDAVDAHDPQAWRGDALFQSESRASYRAICALGYTDGLRACHPKGAAFTFWDYQAGAWQKNNGIRIDHILLSPSAADTLKGASIDSHTRGWEKPSDHVPVWIELD